MTEYVARDKSICSCNICLEGNAVQTIISYCLPTEAIEIQNGAVSMACWCMKQVSIHHSGINEHCYKSFGRTLVASYKVKHKFDQQITFQFYSSDLKIVITEDKYINIYYLYSKYKKLEAHKICSFVF